MFCKVCKDMGLPEKDVKSHNVRNEKGIVCCPTVKSHECRKCGKCGHFEKFCSVKAKDFSEMLLQMSYRTAPAPTKTVPTAKVDTSNAFTALACDSSEEDEVEAKKVVKKPVAKKDWADYSDDEDDEEEELHPNVTRRKHQADW